MIMNNNEGGEQPSVMIPEDSSVRVCLGPAGLRHGGHAEAHRLVWLDNKANTCTAVALKCLFERMEENALASSTLLFK